MLDLQWFLKFHVVEDLRGKNSDSKHVPPLTSFGGNFGFFLV